MIRPGYLGRLPGQLRLLVAVFVTVLSVGFFTGIRFVHFTTNGEPEGIQQQYLGNEEDEEAEEMKFRKSGHEMLNITHTHMLAMSQVFFLVALLVYGTNAPKGLRSFLLIEPLLSVLGTFGGIYLVWLEVRWASYLVMVSGILMTLSYALSMVLILWSCRSRNAVSQ